MSKKNMNVLQRLYLFYPYSDHSSYQYSHMLKNLFKTCLKHEWRFLFFLTFSGKVGWFFYGTLNGFLIGYWFYNQLISNGYFEEAHFGHGGHYQSIQPSVQVEQSSSGPVEDSADDIGLSNIHVELPIPSFGNSTSIIPPSNQVIMIIVSSISQ